MKELSKSAYDDGHLICALQWFTEYNIPLCVSLKALGSNDGTMLDGLLHTMVFADENGLSYQSAVSALRTDSEPVAFNDYYEAVQAERILREETAAEALFP